MAQAAALTWPVTASDQADAAFFTSPPLGVSPDYVQDWIRRRICGCGDILQTLEERRDGICELCKSTGTRTPRPPFTVTFKGAEIPVEPFWIDFWDEEVLAELRRIEGQIGDDFTPPAPRVLRFLEMPEVRCVILGQDPYPQPGVATGRAFEVAGVTSWEDRAVNLSLKNIVKLLHMTYHGLSEPKPIEVVRKDHSFPLPPPNELFERWARQGVLLLNTALTCRVGHPGSHRAIWDAFIRKLIRYIALSAPQAAWILWGSAAQQYRDLLGESARVYTGSHPSARSRSFFNCSCFAATADLIRWV